MPPVIEAVVPRAAGAGDVIDLKGHGFARTTEVLFVNQNAQLCLAGFRVVSDRQLKVEVPDKDVITGSQLVVVVTTEGLTLTLPRLGILRPGRIWPGLPAPRFPPDAILWIGQGDVLADSGTNHLVFIAGGPGRYKPGGSHVLRPAQRRPRCRSPRPGGAVRNARTP